ncbi:hypothetical protein SAMN05216308_103188 [Nitrosospira sp. Nsp13]|jgi:hypothetical protein|nr:hypothetical protein SAMN05216308_103188 [Nitrosospira sp. Nsp13]
MDDSSLPPNVIPLFRSFPSRDLNSKREYKRRGPERRQYSRRRPDPNNQQGPGERELPDRRSHGRRH